MVFLTSNPDAKYFHVHNIGRRWNDESCFNIPGPGLKACGIEPDEPICIACQTYLEKATKVSVVKSEVCGSTRSNSVESSSLVNYNKRCLIVGYDSLR